MTPASSSPVGDWDGGYDAHEARQRRAWLDSTPAQRLEWLEQAIAFAHAAGALGRSGGEAESDEPRQSCLRDG